MPFSLRMGFMRLSPYTGGCDISYGVGPGSLGGIIGAEETGRVVRGEAGEW